MACEKQLVAACRQCYETEEIEKIKILWQSWRRGRKLAKRGGVANL